MRVLVVHNEYRSSSPSGENEVVRLLTNSMSEAGSIVRGLVWKSDELLSMSTGKKVLIAGRMIYSRSVYSLSPVLNSFRPDIIQLHNPIPILPPDYVRSLQEKVPVVQVLHNYRHLCISGNHFRDNKTCFDCLDGGSGALNGIRHGCYRHSRVQSLIMAASEARHRELWRNLDGYVAISRHVREHVLRNGFPRDRVQVIPNPVKAGVGHLSVRSDAQDVLFSGRLVREKGVELLIEAWTRLPDEVKVRRFLHIAGSGPLEGIVRAAALADSTIVYHGQLSAGALAEVGSGCRISAIPSVWEEPFGLTAAEALAAGRGIVVTDRGALPEIAGSNGCAWVSSPGPADFARALQESFKSDMTAVRNAALSRWQDYFSPQTVGRLHLRFLKRIVDSRSLDSNEPGSARR